MNKIIKEQLHKCRIANIPSFDDNTTNLIITKLNANTQQLDWQEQHCYEITIENYIIYEPPNFTLSSNWNNGTKPDDTQLNVFVKKIMGKMINVDACGVNTKTSWSGWLPKGGCKLIKEIILR